MSYIILGMVALVLVVSVVQSFQISGLKKDIASNKLTGAATGAIDMSGWTENEKMMYEHHGTLPARVSGGAQSSGGMVGGC
ncbi:MAG TPA: hypothetical protein VJI46_02455 [Candidatus Nanoarchaeia archaeon]|nr:hypothetical protein [Candidatus Nanoarchaeia archaeon]